MKDEYEVGMSSKEKIMSLLERKGTFTKPDSKIIFIFDFDITWFSYLS